MDLISIIIPTYNRAHLLPRAINSVIEQTYPHWELIIVDDGSTDETNEVVKPYLQDTRIKYFLKKNTGAADSRNFGVAQARYEWVTFLDSDDEAKPQWLESYIGQLRIAPIISCGKEVYNEKAELIDVVIPKQNLSFTAGLFNSGTYILKKNLFDAVGGFDPKLRSGQHTELFVRIISYINENSIRTHVIEKPLVKIHIHNGMRIRTDNKAKYEGSLYYYNKHYYGDLKSKSKRATYEAIIAYNAFRIGKYQESLKYGLLALRNNPSLKNLFRLLRYLTALQ
jgi:glycosyltransferase involved in cell wall biosynthesis